MISANALSRAVSLLGLFSLVLWTSCISLRNEPVSDAATTDPTRINTGGAGGISDPSNPDAPSGLNGGSNESGAGGAGTGPATDPGCPSGMHKCDGTCVSSSEPSHCGNACVACPAPNGGAATCDGTKCGVECPAGKKPCLDSCIDEAASCDGKCPGGKNPCNGICVDASSISACGTACVTCPTSSDGKTTCDGDKCLLACNPGFHACGAGCSKDTDVATCGAGCTPCPVPMGGTATCDGMKCGAQCPSGTALCNGSCIPADKACGGTCPSGTHNCSGNCVSNKDVANCGTSCMPCTPPANGTASCNGTTCDFTCRSGYHRCGDKCEDNNSVNSCGSKCDSACPTASGATATCDGTSCAIKCNANLFMCNDSCQQCCNDGQCGSGKACSNGTCIAACKSGVACTTGIGPCRAGKTFCASSTAQAECRDSGADDSHNTCGGGNLCNGGACVQPCKPGSCGSSSPCHKLVSVCDNQFGQPTCKDQTDSSNSGGCASGKCNGNACAPACSTSSISCSTSVACQTSTAKCASASSNPTCVTATAPNGTGCGGGRTCQGGTCCSANMGRKCVDSSGGHKCQSGKYDCNGSCSGYQPDTGVSGTETGCRNDETCDHGACVGCGAPDQVCCHDTFICLGSLECKNNICTRPAMPPM